MCLVWRLSDLVKCTVQMQNIICVFVALGIQHAMCTHHIVICGLAGSTEWFHSIS